MEAKIKKTGEIVDVYHESQHSQVSNIYKESVFVNGRMWKESELEFIESKEVDLEKEIKNEIDNLSNLYCYMEDLFNGNEEEGVYPIPEKVTNELFEFAKHFFELGLKAQKEE